MAFFGNGAVNRVNIHSGFVSFAEAMGGAFVLAFLLRAGVSVPQALLAWAAIHVARFVLRPAILPLGRRFGLKPVLIAGTLLVAASYPLLGLVEGVGWTLLVYLMVSAMGALFYWTTYHAYFTALGDEEHRGQQIGAREALAAVTGIVAPLAGAWALSGLGGVWSFAIAGVIQALAVVPLVHAPDVAVLDRAPGAWRAARMGLVLFAADGWFAAGFHFVWQIALFTALGQSYAAYGGAMALAGLVGAVTGLLLGRHIDGGGGRRAVVIAYIVAGIVVAMRAASLDLAVLAVVANALGALVVALVVPAQMTAVYNLAKASPCPLRFHIVSEAGWDAGCIGGCLTGAAISAMGLSLAWGIVETLPALGLVVLVLMRLYGEDTKRLSEANRNLG